MRFSYSAVECESVSAVETDSVSAVDTETPMADEQHRQTTE
jgi:hypothetical protein